MKRTFKSKEALRVAARHRQFQLPEPEIAEVEDDELDEMGEEEEESRSPELARLMQATTDYAREASMATMQQNAEVARALIERLNALQVSAPATERPLRWTVRVTGRDYDGKITEMDIRAVAADEDDDG